MWRALPAAWLGLLLSVALLATPAPFATLAKADAGRVVAHILLREAWLSLAVGVGMLAMARARARVAANAGAGSVLSADMLLVLGTLFCTVLGYFGLQPMMAAARAGQGGWTFGQLHAASSALFALKLVLVAALAWRAQSSAAPAAPPAKPPTA